MIQKQRRSREHLPTAVNNGTLPVPQPAPTQGAQPTFPGFMILHEDGHLDVVRVKQSDLGMYAEMMLAVASQLLAEYRKSLAAVNGNVDPLGSLKPPEPPS